MKVSPEIIEKKLESLCLFIKYCEVLELDNENEESDSSEYTSDSNDSDNNSVEEISTEDSDESSSESSSSSESEESESEESEKDSKVSSQDVKEKPKSNIDLLLDLDDIGKIYGYYTETKI